MYDYLECESMCDSSRLELAVDLYHERCNICISYYHRSNYHVCVHGREVNVKGGGTVHLMIYKYK